MKKKHLVLLVIVLAILYVIVIIYNQVPNKVDAQKFSSKRTEQIKNLVKSSIVYGTINKDCHIMDNYENGINKNKIYKGDKVEILKDRGCQWYYIINSNTNDEGWINSQYIDIPADSPTNKNQMSKEEIQDYVNIMNFESDTDYFIWVDIDRQKVNILKGSKGNWELLKSLDCATGKNVSPTTRGNFKISDRGKWFYSERLGSGAKYWVRFNGSYLFHSVAMDKDKNVIDDVLGEKRSSGCVRMSIGNSRWFFEKIPQGTSIFIN